MQFKEILDLMIEHNVTDLFVRARSNLKGRVLSKVQILSEKMFDVGEVQHMVNEVTHERDREKLQTKKGCEFTYWYKEHWRFRVGVFYQRNTPCMVIRKIDLRIPDFQKLNLPEDVLRRFCNERRGLVLLTGITGSGKSTAIASMIQYINKNSGAHILTIEEPIEFTFTDHKSVVNQREIGTDVGSYKDALRQFAVHSPDVIYIGTIRDADTCHAALTAAETGVLVFSTLHTVNAASTVERIINFFPPHQHNLILNQLSVVLKGVISLRLVPRADGEGFVPAYEVLTLSPSISRLLRENKLWEIPKYIAEGDVYGMKSFHQCLLERVTEGSITPDAALQFADKKEEMEMEMRNKGIL